MGTSGSHLGISSSCMSLAASSSFFVPPSPKLHHRKEGGRATARSQLPCQLPPSWILWKYESQIADEQCLYLHLRADPMAAVTNTKQIPPSSWILVNICTVSGSSELNTLGWLMHCQARRHNPKPEKASGRKGGEKKKIKNAELEPSGNIIHRVKQAYYYWRYTKLELADSTIISLRLWHRLTLPLLPPSLFPLPASRFPCRH